MSWEHRLVIYGQPATKKTSNRIVRHGNRVRIIPSLQHERWFQMAMPQAMTQRVLHGDMITQRVNVAAKFYRLAKRGDAVGFYQALADLLERAGVVENDRLCVSWEGSKLLVDKHEPRIEVVLTLAED